MQESLGKSKDLLQLLGLPQYRMPVPYPFSRGRSARYFRKPDQFAEEMAIDTVQMVVDQP